MVQILIKDKSSGEFVKDAKDRKTTKVAKPPVDGSLAEATASKVEIDRKTTKLAKPPVEGSLAEATAPKVEIVGPATRGENTMIRFSDLLIDEAFNVRKTYPLDSLKVLVASIEHTGGLLAPLTVTARPDGKFFLQSGFRRSRALRMIHGAKLDQMMVPARVLQFTNEDDAVFANLAVDQAHEPIRKYDLADRLTYMRQVRKLENKEIAEKSGLGPMTVSQLITCRTKLHSDIIEAWKAAPSVEQEIKFTHLLEWSRHPHEDQLVAFRQYMDAHAADESEDAASVEDGKKKKKKPKAVNVATQKVRPKKQLSTQLEKFEEKKEDLSGEKLGAYRMLRWTLGYTEKLTLG